jgi:hypothetical protein
VRDERRRAEAGGGGSQAQRAAQSCIRGEPVTECRAGAAGDGRRRDAQSRSLETRSWSRGVTRRRADARAATGDSARRRQARATACVCAIVLVHGSRWALDDAWVLGFSMLGWAGWFQLVGLTLLRVLGPRKKTTGENIEQPRK